jgi:glycosyltransferase involved in cell wall biosynthesis
MGNLDRIGFSLAHCVAKRNIPILWDFGDVVQAHRGLAFSRGFLTRLLGRTLLRTARDREAQVAIDYAIFISTYVQKFFTDRGLVRKRGFIIPRGIEFPLAWDFDRVRDDPPILLMAGRLCEIKGFHLALEAAQLLHDRMPDLPWQLHFAGVGDPAYELRLRAAVQQSPGLLHRVHLLGQLERAELIERMKTATAFISAALFEPFGRTLIEALALGTPLVASEEGAVFEIVSDGVSALTYPKHSVENLAQQMERVLLDPELRSGLARAGLERAQAAFTMERVLDLTEQAMQSVLNEDPIFSSAAA